MGGKAGFRIAYINQKVDIIQLLRYKSIISISFRLESIEFDLCDIIWTRFNRFHGDKLKSGF